MPELPVKIKKIFYIRRIPFSLILVCCWLFAVCCSEAHAAGSYGARLPDKNKINMGLESYFIFKRYLNDDYGKLRSSQYFLLLSYGVFDWLSIDLKGGAGNLKAHPPDQSEIDYNTNFAGGYGFRVKFYDQKNLKCVFGFQHISVHPSSKTVGSEKNQAILDDWQFSLLGAYDFKMLTPYLGTRWSKIDYIHKVGGNRVREYSDRTKSFGLICGFDLPIAKRTWLNLEGQFFDSEALSFSLNVSF